MFVYPCCPFCGFQNHISLFRKERKDEFLILVCPKCKKKFTFEV